MNLIEYVQEKQLKKDITPFNVGDTVKVNVIIKEWEKSIDRQGVSLEIYIGSAIHSVRSMDAEYKTNNGKIYTQKNISLERLLQE